MVLLCVVMLLPSLINETLLGIRGSEDGVAMLLPPLTNETLFRYQVK
jgi:hypothetical protein